MTSGDDRFANLYRNHVTAIRAYCHRRTSSDKVDDAVADTFITAWRKIDDIPRGPGELPWLYGVAYKVIGHQWRGVSRRRSLHRKLEGIGLVPGSTPDEVLVANEETLQVRAALDRLRRIDKEILLLAAWESLDGEEIAAALGISYGAARQRLYQARKNLTREYNRLERYRDPSPAAQEGGAW